MHVHLFCRAGTDNEAVTCDREERLAHLSAFVKEALYRPHSTFSIWGVGPDRSGTRRFFGACIPEHWPGPVWKEKADFLVLAREGAGGSRRGVTVPAGCRAPGPQTPGRTQLVVSPDVSALAGDVWQTVSSGAAPAPLHSAIVCDRSESTRGVACMPSALLRVFDRWVTESLLLPGASLAVEMVGPLQDALHSIFSLRVPHLPLGERTAYVLGARSELGRLFAGPPEQYASTIAEAISATVRRLREHRGAYRLSLLSDLLQITPGVWNFEHTLPQPNDFLAWLRKAGVAADLRDIPILACGLHTGQSLGGNGPYTPAYATRLRDLWERAFQAMGAPEVKFYSSCEAAFAAS